MVKKLSNTFSSLYLAYGSNVNPVNMKRRCPRALALGQYELRGYEFEFRSVANLKKRKGAFVMGVLWKITPKCEQTLDRYEEYPKVYSKKYVLDRKLQRYIMFYVLRNIRMALRPSKQYKDCILGGYKIFGLPESQIWTALDRLIIRGVRASSKPAYHYDVL